MVISRLTRTLTLFSVALLYAADAYAVEGASRVDAVVIDVVDGGADGRGDLAQALAELAFRTVQNGVQGLLQSLAAVLLDQFLHDALAHVGAGAFVRSC